MTPEQIALAVINDGSTYAKRKEVMRQYATATIEQTDAIYAYRRMAWDEARKPIYEGTSFSSDDARFAAWEIHSYMVNHWNESNNGKDWT